MIKWGKAAAVAAAAVLVASCSSSLADRDPDGAKACQTLVDSLKAKDATTRAGAILVAGQQASKAKTEAIRASADELLPGQWMAKPDKLTKACEAEGYDVPAVTPADG